MKKISLFVLPVFAALTFLLSGCATTVRENPPEPSVEPTSADYKLCRDLLRCFINDDPKGFNALLSPENRKQFTVEKFDQTRKDMLKSLGEPVSFTYLTRLEFTAFNPYIWKVRFRRIGQNKKEIFQEALFRIVVGHTAKDELYVMGFNFL